MTLTTLLETVCGLSSSFVAGKISVQQRKWLKAMELRIDATKRLLDSLKSVKMRGAEDRVGQVVNELRRLEIRAARPFRALLTVAVFLCKCQSSAYYPPGKYELGLRSNDSLRYRDTLTASCFRGIHRRQWRQWQARHGYHVLFSCPYRSSDFPIDSPISSLAGSWVGSRMLRTHSCIPQRRGEVSGVSQ